MEPLDKNDQNIQNTPVVAPVKHNNLLIILLLVMLLAVASFSSLMVYQTKYVKNKNVADSVNIQTATPIDETIDTAANSTDQLNKPVTSDVDSEIKNLDLSIKTQKDPGFSDANLSDTSLGL